MNPNRNENHVPAEKPDGEVKVNAAGAPALAVSQQVQGTPEETKLTVKILGEEWIVENGVGESIGSAEDRESAVDLAKQAALQEKASSISVLAADGAVERTIQP